MWPAPGTSTRRAPGTALAMPRARRGGGGRSGVPATTVVGTATHARPAREAVASGVYRTAAGPHGRGAGAALAVEDDPAAAGDEAGGDRLPGGPGARPAVGQHNRVPGLGVDDDPVEDGAVGPLDLERRRAV